MKIAHVIWGLGIGGSESMLVDIVNEQSKTEDAHLIILNNDIEKNLLSSVSKRVTCHLINRPRGSKNPFFILVYNVFLLKIKPDTIHCHDESLISFIFCNTFLKTKIVLTVHNINIPTVNFIKYHTLFSISNAVKTDVLKNCGISTKTIYNGIKTSKINKKTNYSFDTFKVVQIGRLDIDQKGQDILLKALSILKKKYKVTNIYIDFIGDGDSKEYLINLADRLKVKDMCSFSGKKSREYIYQHIYDYNLLVQPSRFEGFGLTVAEGMAAKVPVLVSNIDGPMEIIKNGSLGYYFKSQDSQNCADKIISIMKNYHSTEIKEKVNKGCRHIEKTFNIQNTAQEYLRQY
ncbi:MAG: glycosyltransferase [Spirochaetes bacterium]|nr:glycosyltransferase [Spirochaetota bacterium]